MTRCSNAAIGVVAAMAFIVSVGVDARAAGPAPLNPSQKVKIAYVPIMKFATAYVAAGRGLFKKYGLDVEFEKVKSGTEAIAFLQQGTVDVGGIAIVTSLWNSWNRGLDIRIIAPGGLEPLKGSSLLPFTLLPLTTLSSALTAPRTSTLTSRTRSDELSFSSVTFT